MPTRRRLGVIGFAVALAVVTYIDRVCISQAAPAMRADLGLSAAQMGWAFSAFFWAYALFEVPSGWLGDRIGARKVLMRVVIWWSFFTAATGWVFNFGSLLVTRAMFGAGEAGCFPNVTRAFTTWLPRSERLRAQGILWLSARWGGAFTPLLVALLLEHLSWRRTFELFGLLGVVWAVLFYRWYRDDPRLCPGINAAELALLPPTEEVTLGHDKVPWRALVQSRSVWLLCLQFFCLNFGAVFYITWLPTYLREARGMTLTQGAVLAGLPLFFGGLGSLFCGFISAPLARWTGSVTAARRWLAGTGFLGAALCLALSAVIPNPWLAMGVMGLASFCNDLVMPPSWGTCMDVGGKSAGTLSGAMNMLGNFGGGVASIVIGYLLLWSQHNWNLALFAAATAYFLGSLCWFALDPVTPLEKSTTEPARPAR